METITFYSYKGGSGRSLALANAARYLARLEFSVVALDFDLEAPGLQYKFSTSADGRPVAVQLGIVDYLYKLLVEGGLGEPIKNFKVDISVPGSDKPLIGLIPAGQVPSSEYWSRLSRLNWHDILYAKGAKGVEVFLDLKNRIEDELKPDFLLVDSRTGITEMGGVATTLLADKVICLVLPSPENLEGARAVLRSLKRSRRDFGLQPVEIVVALSRFPQIDQPEPNRQLTLFSGTQNAQPEGEPALLDWIRNSLNEEADDLRDTLACKEIFVLHSESALEIRETLRVGSGISPDDSILLRDYLRLFARIVPKNLIESKLGKLIVQAREKIWQDPDGAMKEVEEMAESFGHPEAYRALLQFYEVRNVTGGAILRRAQRLWELTGDASDAQVWYALRRSFGQEPRWQRARHLNFEFVESVWRNAGKRDVEFGAKIAEQHDYNDKPSRAADITIEIIKNTEPSAALVSRCIRRLDAARRSAEAEVLIREYREKFGTDPEFIESWAMHAWSQKSKESVALLLDPGVFELLRRTKPALAMRVLAAGGRKKELKSMANEMLRDAIAGGSLEGLEELGRAFADVGYWDEFVEKVREVFPQEVLERIIRLPRLRR